MKNTSVALPLLLFLILLTVFAFWKSYFGIFQNLPETATLRLHAHALMMCIWLLMLCTQAGLIRAKKFKIHRLIGRTSYIIVPILIYTGLLLIHEVFNRTSGEIPEDSLRLNVYSFGQLFAFLITWGLAIYYRKKSHIHMRFMISTAFAIGTAIIFRVFIFWSPIQGQINPSAIASWFVTVSLLLILIAIDWRLGIKRSVYWVVTILISSMHISYLTITKSTSYLYFCEWYRNLPEYIFFG